LIEQIKDILQGETSKSKAEFYDKLFTKLNRINTRFLLNLAWELCKAYRKQAEPFCEIKDGIDKEHHKKGVMLCSKALEYYNWASTQRQNHPEFKSDQKFNDLK